MPLNFVGVKSKDYGNVFTLKMQADEEYTRYTYINNQSILEIICEIGGFSILLWYFCKYLSSFVQPFYLQVALIRELFRTDPKIPNKKVNLFGIMEEEFQAELIYKAFAQHEANNGLDGFEGIQPNTTFIKSNFGGKSVKRMETIRSQNNFNDVRSQKSENVLAKRIISVKSIQAASQNGEDLKSARSNTSKKTKQTVSALDINRKNSKIEEES